MKKKRVVLGVGLLLTIMCGVVGVFIYNRAGETNCGGDKIKQHFESEICGLVVSDEKYDWYAGKVDSVRVYEQMALMMVNFGKVSREFNLGFLDKSRLLVAPYKIEDSQSFSSEMTILISETEAQRLNNVWKDKYVAFHILTETGKQERMSALLDATVNNNLSIDVKTLASKEIEYWEKCGDYPGKLRSLFQRTNELGAEESSCYPPIGTIYEL